MERDHSRENVTFQDLTPCVFLVGRAYRKTPVFSGDMSYLVFNPYWEVPQSIAVKDKLPLFQKDPDAFHQGGFEVLSSSSENSKKKNVTNINWATVNPAVFPYRLRQRPGPQNALGRVKLMFPNPFNVYLHDTPDRHLFDQDIRTYSSGCIRLQKPLELAAWVLASQPGWNREHIDRTVSSGETKTVMLKLLPYLYMFNTGRLGRAVMGKITSGQIFIIAMSASIGL